MNLIQFDSYSDIGGRENNEDSAGAWKKRFSGKHAFVVADGLGGHGGGKTASTAVISSIQENWTGEVSIREWTRLVDAAHEAVKARQNKTCKMKSTLVGLLISGNTAVWAHAGDSRLYHFYEEELVFQTRDHSASQLAVMLGEIEPEQIRFHEARNQVLKALGQAGKLTAEYKEETLAKGNHAFLLCTDGFWEHITEPEMTGLLSDAQSPKQWLQEMRRTAETRMKPDSDNHTAIAVFLKNI